MKEKNEKKCTKCNKVKPFNEFYINNVSPDGRYFWCKECFDRYSARQGTAGNLNAENKIQSGHSDQTQKSIEPVAKRCVGCKETKLIRYFPNDTRSDDGVGAYCKACHVKIDRISETVEYVKAEKAAHKEKAEPKRRIEALPTKKRCIKCNQVKPVSEFYGQPGLKDGFSFQCRTCLREYNERYQKALERQVEQEKLRRHKSPIQPVPKERKCNGCGKNEPNDESARTTLIPVHAWFCEECAKNKTSVYIKKGTFVFDLVGREYKVTKVLTDELVKGVFKKDDGRWGKQKVNIYGNWKIKK
jgi:hypothetical protein